MPVNKFTSVASSPRVVAPFRVVAPVTVKVPPVLIFVLIVLAP